jgi:outer membrane protein TolC
VISVLMALAVLSSQVTGQADGSAVRSDGLSRSSNVRIWDELAAGQPGPDLAEVTRLSVRGSPEIRQARAALEVAASQADEASIDLWPRLKALARYTRFSEVEEGRPQLDPALVREAAERRSVGIEDADAARYGLQTFPQFPNWIAARAELSYGISDVLLRVLPTIQAAEWRELEQRSGEKDQIQRVALVGRRAYFEYARARAAGSVMRDALAEARQQDAASRMPATWQAGTSGRKRLPIRLSDGDDVDELVL